MIQKKVLFDKGNKNAKNSVLINIDRVDISREEFDISQDASPSKRIDTMPDLANQIPATPTSINVKPKTTVSTNTEETMEIPLEALKSPSRLPN